jgi:dephospho-CoA kinase
MPFEAEAVHGLSAMFLSDKPRFSDKVVVVSAPPEVQRARVFERTGMTAAKLDSILARQLPDEEKRKRADFVIDTGTDLSTTERQVGEILSCLGVAASR